MKVKELIKKLEKYNLESTVFCGNSYNSEDDYNIKETVLEEDNEEDKICIIIDK